MCFRCLSSDHKGAECPHSEVCGIDGCEKTHNHLLHAFERVSIEPSGEATEPVHDVDKQEYSHTALGEDQPSIALRTVPVILRNGTKSISVNALLDDGSTRTYINTDVAAELELLTGECDEITVGTMGGAKRTFPSEAVSLVIESADQRTSRSIQAFTAANVTGAMRAVQWQKFAPEWKHLKGLAFSQPSSRKTVDMLIGIDHADLHASIREVSGKPGEPIARLTPLGWTCVGKTRRSKNCNDSVHNANLSYFVNGGITEINRTLERFWEIEEPRCASPIECMSVEEQATYKTVQQSMSRSVKHSSMYQVGMPWKSETSGVPNNIETARKRLECTEKSLLKRKLGDAYHTIVQQYLEKRIHSQSEQRRVKWTMVSPSLCDFKT